MFSATAPFVAGQANAAGCEKSRQTGAERGSKLWKEETHINSSPTALGKTFTQLADPNGEFVSYRESVLTQALQVRTYEYMMHRLVVGFALFSFILLPQTSMQQTHTACNADAHVMNHHEIWPCLPWKVHDCPAFAESSASRLHVNECGHGQDVLNRMCQSNHSRPLP